MTTTKPEIIYRKDYKKPDFLIKNVDFEFDLHDTKTTISASLNIEKDGDGNKIILNGENLILKSIFIDEKELSPHEYTLSDNLLIIENVPDKFTLKIKTEINPIENKALEGLYKSGDIFCTQNEPEGFRRITYFIDRPDVMSKYRTKIIADKSKYPILLSNGNLIDRGDLSDNKHFVIWEDPFAKPSYLFALVAGDLDLLADKFTTRSGREISLEIFCDKGNRDKLYHAMTSLKKAMKWDEDRFNLEYDLDIYMIVAVDSFNMGAMENKGLNIFNSSYVLANSETATDANFLGIEGVIGHEYFHNWTGNRITCRDWFQLTLKEGLTVFRDQEFSADMQSKSMIRIQNADILRTHQFLEDAGPTAHPIRPDSYIEINNFYTITVYDKGSEVIRMLHTILGEEKFQKGMVEYFKLYDGQAVTCDDFIYAMESANGMDLSQFKNWYNRSGTPVVHVNTEYNEKEKKYFLTVKQELNDDDSPLLIPLNIGLLDSNGKDILLNNTENLMLEFKEKEKKYVFENIPEKGTLSINRNFSSPVKIITDLTIDDELFLFSNDSDDFNRWDAGQKVLNYNIKNIISAIQKNNKPEVDEKLFAAFRNILKDKNIDYLYKRYLLLMPEESFFFLEYEIIDFDTINEAIKILNKSIAQNLKDDLYDVYNSIELTKEYNIDIESIGKRRLKLATLDFLIKTGDRDAVDLAFNHFKNSNNMTDKIGSLSALSETGSEEYKSCLDEFYSKWKDELLVMTKWFALQASINKPDILTDIKVLEKNSVFDMKIPNLVRALIGSFARNYINFHDKSGDGYRYLSGKILEIDKFNPSISSSLSGGFKLYSRVDENRRNKMEIELIRIISAENLSKNTYEIVYKILNEKIQNDKG